jgi:hypothetical protein
MKQHWSWTVQWFKTVGPNKATLELIRTGCHSRILDGPSCFEGRVCASTGRHLSMPWASILLAIYRLCVDEPFCSQQDGTPIHYSRDVRRYLDETSPGQWTGCRGSIECPSRAPDILLDFYFREVSEGRVSKVSYPRNRPWRPIRLWNVKDPILSRQSIHRWR